MAAPYSPTIGVPFGYHTDHQGFELRRATLWNLSASLTTTYGATPPDGAFGYQTVAVGTQDSGTAASTKKHIVYYDGADITVPRSDCTETIISPWAFNRSGSNPPITCNQTLPSAGSTATQVTNFNANYVNGYDTSLTAVQNKIPVYASSGRLKVATPTDTDDAVTKAYADALGAGLNIATLGPVQAATTASIADLSNATVTHDGVTLVEGQDLLVKDNASPDGVIAVSAKYNGIFRVGVVSGGSAPLTRRTDADSTAELDRCYTYVEDGTVNQGSSWVQTTNDPVIGTDNIVWTKFYQAVAQNPGNGIDITGNIISVKISAATTYTANRVLFNSSTTTIDGSANLTFVSPALTIGVAGSATGALKLTGATSGTVTTTVAATAGTWTFTLPTGGGTANYALITDGSGTASWSILPVAGGGTGAATLTGMLKGNGTSAITAITGATNRVTFWSDANTLSSNAGFTYDGTTLMLDADITLTGAQTIQTSTGTLTIQGNAGATSMGGTLSVTGVAAFGGATSAAIGIRILNAALTGADQSGLNSQPVFSSSATATARGVQSNIETAAASFTVANAYGFLTATPTIGAGSAITNIHGLRVNNQGVSGVTNAYGIYIEAQSGAATTNIGLNNEGTTRLVGTVTLTAMTAKSVLFAGTSGAVSQDNANFQYDSTNIGLGIGAAANAALGLYILRSGAKTVDNACAQFEATATSSTASIRKAALELFVSGTWNGSGATAVGLYIGGVSGGTTNWALYNNTAADVYLGTGNVGIGATSPGRNLVVNGGASEGVVQVTNNTSGTAAGNGFEIIHFTSGETQLINRENGAMVFYANNTEWMRISSTGSVGIGTTGPASKGDITTNSLGTTQTDTSGLVLATTTAAAAGAQQISPALRFRAFGWKTDATAASQSVDFRIHSVPVQGAAAPTAYLTFASSINGAAYTELFRVGSATLTASAVVVTDADKQLASGGSLPAGSVVARGYTATLSGAAASYTVTHNLNTKHVVVQIYKVSTGETWHVQVTRSTVNAVVIDFGFTAADGEFQACIAATA